MSSNPSSPSSPLASVIADLGNEQLRAERLASNLQGLSLLAVAVDGAPPDLPEVLEDIARSAKALTLLLTGLRVKLAEPAVAAAPRPELTVEPVRDAVGAVEIPTADDFEEVTPECRCGRALLVYLPDGPDGRPQLARVCPVCRLPSDACPCDPVAPRPGPSTGTPGDAGPGPSQAAAAAERCGCRSCGGVVIGDAGGRTCLGCWRPESGCTCRPAASENPGPHHGDDVGPRPAPRPTTPPVRPPLQDADAAQLRELEAEGWQLEGWAPTEGYRFAHLVLGHVTAATVARAFADVVERMGAAEFLAVYLPPAGYRFDGWSPRGVWCASDAHRVLSDPDPVALMQRASSLRAAHLQAASQGVH